MTDPAFTIRSSVTLLSQSRDEAIILDYLGAKFFLGSMTFHGLKFLLGLKFFFGFKSFQPSVLRRCLSCDALKVPMEGSYVVVSALYRYLLHGMTAVSEQMASMVDTVVIQIVCKCHIHKIGKYLR